MISNKDYRAYTPEDDSPKNPFADKLFPLAFKEYEARNTKRRLLQKEKKETKERKKAQKEEKGAELKQKNS